MAFKDKFIFRVVPNPTQANLSKIEWRGFLDADTQEIVIYDDAAGVELFRMGNRLGNAADVSFACSDETTPLTVGADKITLNAPFDFTLNGLFAGLTTPQASGATFLIDVLKNGVSVFDIPLSIDNGQATSLTSSVPYALNPAQVSFTKGDEIKVSILTIGDGTATGLKVYLDVIR